MGFVLQNLCEITLLGAGVYGATRGWNSQLADRIHRISDGRLEEIADMAPKYMRPLVYKSIDVLPYTVAVYCAVNAGGKLAGLL